MPKRIINLKYRNNDNEREHFMIAIVDYGIGNIHSLVSAFQSYQVDGKAVEIRLTSDEDLLREAELVILPGVGAFNYAMEELEKRNLVSLIRQLHQGGKKIMGICLGMQLMYDSSEEHGLCKGLGLLKGKVVKLPDCGKTTHMGWNELEIKTKSSSLVKEIEMDRYVYFVHSYYASNVDGSTVVASTNYGVEIPAIVQLDNLIGYQFHPEKSGKIGARLIQNILDEWR